MRMDPPIKRIWQLSAGIREGIAAGKTDALIADELDCTMDVVQKVRAGKIMRPGGGGVCTWAESEASEPAGAGVTHRKVAASPSLVE